MAAISKNVYVNVLNDIANKYNNTVHKTINILILNVLMLQMIMMLNTKKNLIKKILNLMMVTMYKFQNIKIFLPKDILLIGQKILLIKLIGNKMKNAVPRTYSISDLNN